VVEWGIKLNFLRRLKEKNVACFESFWCFSRQPGRPVEISNFLFALATEAPLQAGTPILLLLFPGKLFLLLLELQIESRLQQQRVL
jgi:hypothetical protein